MNIIPNIYAPYDKTSKCMKQKLIELHGEIDKSIITVEEFNNPTQ